MIPVLKFFIFEIKKILDFVPVTLKCYFKIQGENYK